MNDAIQVNVGEPPAKSSDGSRLGYARAKVAERMEELRRERLALLRELDKVEAQIVGLMFAEKVLA